LKHLDLRKITPEMREAGGSKDGKGKEDKGETMSTEISPDKQGAGGSMIGGGANSGAAGGGAGATDDISPEGLLEVIS
jgi:hypothetical protein